MCFDCVAFLLSVVRCFVCDVFCVVFLLNVFVLVFCFGCMFVICSCCVCFFSVYVVFCSFNGFRSSVTVLERNIPNLDRLIASCSGVFRVLLLLLCSCVCFCFCCSCFGLYFCYVFSLCVVSFGLCCFPLFRRISFFSLLARKKHFQS